MLVNHILKKAGLNVAMGGNIGKSFAIQIAQKKSACGYLSQSDPRIHFGLDDQAVVEKIEVMWPSGATQVLENVEAGKIITITEGEHAV